MSKKYTLLGEKLGHSLSPQIHSMLGDYEYTLSPVSPGQLDEFFSSQEYDGFNVTIPYKVEAYNRCDVLSGRAGKIKSVNTCFRLPDGRLFGENTDYFGFEYLVKRAECNPTGKKVVILGSGGSEKTVRTVMYDMGASEIVTISRSGENNYSNISAHYDCDIIVNTTPVGMFPSSGESVIDIKNFKKCGYVFDLIYNPFRTKLLLDAEREGKIISDGLPMLVAQGKMSSDIFMGTYRSNDIIEEIAKKIREDTANIVIIGMPGCGKTTYGKKISAEKGRCFIDTDELIEKKQGMTIPEIFEKYGEEYFRDLETEVIRQIRNMRSAVISVGGGAILREENRDILRENSVVYYLDIPLNKLATENRPVTASEGLEKIYEERREIYEKTADIIVGEDER